MSGHFLQTYLPKPWTVYRMISSKHIKGTTIIGIASNKFHSDKMIRRFLSKDPMFENPRITKGKKPFNDYTEIEGKIIYSFYKGRYKLIAQRFLIDKI